MSFEDDFGELVLIAGDFHIPQRTSEIPDEFKELMVIISTIFRAPTKCKV